MAKLKRISEKGTQWIVFIKSNWFEIEKKLIAVCSGPQVCFFIIKYNGKTQTKIRRNKKILKNEW